jgi:hypothetical protein
MKATFWSASPALLILAGTLIGCDGSHALSVDAGASDGAPVDRPRLTPDGGIFYLDALPPVAIPPNPDSLKVYPGNFTLLGSAQTGCSNQQPPSGDRWCAFHTPDAEIGRNDLWVINMTKVVAGVAVTCDPAGKVADPNCLRLTRDLWIGTPTSGQQRFPTVHRFDGDNLIFHAEAPTGLSEYNGLIYGWRPGQAQAKKLTGAHGYTCVGHRLVSSYFCYENISTPGQVPLSFELTAGRMDDAAGTQLVARILPQRMVTNAPQYRVMLSPKGDLLSWSTGGATVASPEVLSTIAFADLGQPARIVSAPNPLSQWAIAADSQKIYYLKDWNYPPGDGSVAPAGTLMMADYPGGTNPVQLATGVASLQALAIGDNDAGVGFLETPKPTGATYKHIRDRNNPAQVQTVVPNLAGLVGLSPDLRYVYYYRGIDQQNSVDNLIISDAWIARTDGTGQPCALATFPSAAQFGAPFSPSGKLVFWVDNINVTNFTGEGWVANPEGCVSKRKWGDAVDFWFIHGDDGMVFSDTTDDVSAVLKSVAFPGGDSVGTPNVIQVGVDRNFNLMDFRAILYGLADSTSAKKTMYAYTRLPFGGLTADGGATPAPDAGARDTGPDAPPPDLAPSPPDAAAGQ